MEKWTTTISFMIAVVGIIYLMTKSDLASHNTIGTFRTISHLFLIALAIIYFLHSIVKREHYDFLQSPFFWFSSINLLHYSSLLVIFTFFSDIQGQGNLLYFSIFLKWGLLVLTNLIFAYVFFKIAKGQMNSI